MDFWRIVGIVLWIVALTTVSKLLGELREKKQAEKNTPVLTVKPGSPFTMKLHFQNRLKTNLDKVNARLAEYELSKLELVQHSGYLETETKTDAATGKQTVGYWYGLDDITLLCTPAKPGEGLDFRLSTMTAEKTVQDCALLWQENNPGRKLCGKVFQEYDSVYALIFIHHAVNWCGGNITWRQEGDMLCTEGMGSIYYGAFRNRHDLRKVVIGSGCTAIGAEAFLGCTGLTRIVIPGSVRRISAGAFEGCSALADIRLPDGIQVICANTFRGCTSLTHITIPERVTEICAQAFQGCSGLTSITIPNSVTEIGRQAFEGCTELASITIPDSVRTIGAEAFRGCSGLTSITIPDSVWKIGKDAFRDVPHIFCSGTLRSKGYWGAKDGTYVQGKKIFCGRPGKDTLTWHMVDDTLYIEGQGRLRCGSNNWFRDTVRHVVIAPGCTAIADFVFQKHHNLESIDLPDTLRTIGERAFCGCEKLREVNIPDSVIGIGKGAFSGCKNLEKVHLPRNLTQIHDDTFFYCASLENVQIPDSVHYIGSHAFHRVKSINNLPLNLGNWGTKTLGYCKRGCGLGVGAFAIAGLPAHIEIPDRVSIIPEGAFGGCKSLVSVKFPRYVTEIGSNAFFGCSQLECLEIPETVTEIGGYAFYDVPHILYHGPAQSDDNWGAKSRS